MNLDSALVRALLSTTMLAGAMALFGLNRPYEREQPHWAGEGYSLREAKFLGNEHVFSILGFNDRGHIAGSGIGNDKRFVAQLIVDSEGQDLPTLPGYLGSRAYGLNNRDAVVGACYKKGASYSVRPTRACVWESGVPRELAPLPGLPCSRAWALNDQGQVVGTSYKPESEERNAAMLPTLWQGKQAIPLPLPKGAVQGEARRVNAKGDVIGVATTPGGESIACLWRNRELLVLPPLPGGKATSAAGINDLGTVVGLCDGKPVLWANGTPKEMERYPGAPSLSPVGIDNAGNVLINNQAKPVNEIDDDPALPLLYRAGTGYTRISHLVPSGGRIMFTKGLAINEKGQLAVGAMLDGNRVRITVLTPPSRSG